MVNRLAVLLAIAVAIGGCQSRSRLAGAQPACLIYCQVTVATGTEDEAPTLPRL